MNKKANASASAASRARGDIHQALDIFDSGWWEWLSTTRRSCDSGAYFSDAEAGALDREQVRQERRSRAGAGGRWGSSAGLRERGALTEGV